VIFYIKTVLYFLFSFGSRCGKIVSAIYTRYPGVAYTRSSAGSRLHVGFKICNFRCLQETRGFICKQVDKNLTELRTYLHVCVQNTANVYLTDLSWLLVSSKRCRHDSSEVMDYRTALKCLVTQTYERQQKRASMLNCAGDASFCNVHCSTMFDVQTGP